MSGISVRCTAPSDRDERGLIERSFYREGDLAVGGCHVAGRRERPHRAAGDAHRPRNVTVHSVGVRVRTTSQRHERSLVAGE